MDEGTAYKWARQALRPFEGKGEAHLYQQAADLVASAILEAFANGQKNHVKNVQHNCP